MAEPGFSNFLGPFLCDRFAVAPTAAPLPRGYGLFCLVPSREFPSALAFSSPLCRFPVSRWHSKDFLGSMAQPVMPKASPSRFRLMSDGLPIRPPTRVDPPSDAGGLTFSSPHCSYVTTAEQNLTVVLRLRLRPRLRDRLPGRINFPRPLGFRRAGFSPALCYSCRMISSLVPPSTVDLQPIAESPYRSTCSGVLAASWCLSPVEFPRRSLDQ